MEHKQARNLLQKINRLYEAIAASDTPPSAIEVDLLRDYIRQFYDRISMPASPEIGPIAEPVRVESRPHHPVSPVVEPAAKVSESPRVEPEPVKQEIVMEVASDVTSEPEVAPVIPEPTPAPVSPVAEPLTEPEDHAPASDYEVLFATEEARDLSDRLRTSPIDDLSRAMGINERFLTINELFDGNHEDFDQVLRRLNDLSSFQTARTYLEQNVIPKYNWMDKGRVKKAGVFIRLIRRRYL